MIIKRTKKKQTTLMLYFAKNVLLLTNTYYHIYPLNITTQHLNANDHSHQIVINDFFGFSIN